MIYRAANARHYLDPVCPHANPAPFNSSLCRRFAAGCGTHQQSGTAVLDGTTRSPHYVFTSLATHPLPRLMPPAAGTSPRSGCPPRHPRSLPARMSACTAGARRARARAAPATPAPWLTDPIPLPRWLGAFSVQCVRPRPRPIHTRGAISPAPFLPLCTLCSPCRQLEPLLPHLPRRPWLACHALLPFSLRQRQF